MKKELKQGIRKRRKLWLIGLAAVSMFAVPFLMTVILRGSDNAILACGMLVSCILCVIWLICRARTGRADKSLRDFLYRVHPFEKKGEYPERFCLPLWIYDGPVDRLKRFEQKGIAVLIDRPKRVYRLLCAVDEEKQMLLLSDTREDGAVSLSKEDSAYQRTLYLIYTKASGQDEAIRRKALKEITDQGILTSLAESERTEVFDRIADQHVLADIAMRSRKSVATEAIKAMTDEQQLAEVALKADDMVIRRKAVKSIRDEQLLARIARESTLAGWDALLQIRDPQLLAEIAADRNIGILIREEALDRLEDQSLLRLIAVNNDEPIDFRWRLAQKLKDKQLLAELKDEHEQWEKEEKERAERKEQEEIKERLDYWRRKDYATYLRYLESVDPDAYHEQTENRV